MKLINNKDSSDYIKKIGAEQPYIVKSLELLLNDKKKLNNIGVPIKLISHDVYVKPDVKSVDVFLYFLKCFSNKDIKFKTFYRLEWESKVNEEMWICSWKQLEMKI